jgi:hypothetical protein
MDRNRRLWISLLVSASVCLLLADLALGRLIVRITASPPSGAGIRARTAVARDDAAELAMILPDPDPHRPVPAATPTSVPTPWVILETAPAPPTSSQAVSPAPSPTEPPTLPAATDTPSLPTASPTPAPAPKAAAVIARGSGPVVTTPTPTPFGYKGPPTPLPTLTPSSSTGTSPQAGETTTEGGAAAGGVGNLSSDSAQLASGNNSPGSTGVVSGATTEPTPTAEAPLPFAPGDEAAFVDYVQGHYNTLAGQPLDVASVGFVQRSDGLPAVEVEINVTPASNPLSAQTDDLQAYATQLLDDTVAYFASQPTGVQIVGDFATQSQDECASSPASCFVNGFISDSDGWSVSWVYVTGFFDGQADTLDYWSPAQAANSG